MTALRDGGTTGLRERGRLVGGATLSQSFSAVSNFVILLALARTGGSSAVGGFVLAFTVYNAAMGLQRALISDPLLGRVPGATAPQADEEACAATATLLITALAIVVVLILAVVTPYDQLFYLALMLPGLLLQDLCRYLFFRQSRPHLAARLDGLWAAVSCLSLIVLEHHPTSDAALVLWGIGAFLSAGLGLILAGVRFAPPARAVRWWNQNLRQSGRWFTLQAAVFHLDQAFIAFGFTALAGAAAIGEMRLALSLVGLPALLTTGISIIAVTELTHREGDGRSTAARVAVVNFVFIMATTGLLLLMASRLIHVVYGDEVQLTSGTLLATGVAVALTAAAHGPLALLRARQAERAMPAARFAAFAICATAAVAVSGHSFQAALWLLAAEALVFLVLVSVAAHRLGPVPETGLTDALDELPT